MHIGYEFIYLVLTSQLTTRCDAKFTVSSIIFMLAPKNKFWRFDFFTATDGMGLLPDT